MKIEWASSFRPDGTRRRPPPSTMHGWLAKMRGTLIGDETLRSKGMREMREARAVRKHNREKRRQLQSGNGLFSFLTTRKKPSRSVSRGGHRGHGQRPNRLVARPSQTRPPQSRKPSGSSGISRRPTVSSRSSQSRSRPQYNTTRRGSRQ